MSDRAEHRRRACFRKRTRAIAANVTLPFASSSRGGPGGGSALTSRAGARRADRSLDLRDDGLGLVDAAVEQEPPRALGDVMAQEEDRAAEHGAEERTRNASRSRAAEARVEKDEREPGAERDAEPVGAVDGEIDAPRRRAGISSSIAELIAAYSPPMPAPVSARERGERQQSSTRAPWASVPNSVDRERDEEEAFAPERVGESPEDEARRRRPRRGTRVAVPPICVAETQRAGLCRDGADAPTRVASRPSSTHVMPSAKTTRRCHRDHGRRRVAAGRRS